MTESQQTTPPALQELLRDGTLAGSWSLDPARSVIGLKSKSMWGMVPVRGVFGEVSGSGTVTEAGEVTGTLTVAAGSIDTKIKKRDDHLRSADFFDVEKFPKIAFQSAGVSDLDASGHKGKMHGALTMHGVTKPVVLDVAFLGKGKDPGGKERAGFHATTTVDRKEFGLTWNKTVESGGLLVGDDVTIEIDVEAIQEG